MQVAKTTYGNYLGNGQAHGFTIDATGHLMQLLTKMYSKLELAVVREIMANAMDASNGKPIKVHLPTLARPQFIVRDYGDSMSQEFMLSGYLKFGSSTKSNTDDKIGGFGIGRVAPLAYTNEYFVNTYINGIKRVYHVFMDESPKLMELTCEDTTKHNGTEVIVPVSTASINEFKKWTHFLARFHPNVQLSEPIANNYLFSVEDFSFFKSEAQSVYILQMGIPYKVDFRYFNKPFNADIVIKVDGQKFEIAPNREQLVVTSELTNFVSKRLDSVYTVVKKFAYKVIEYHLANWNKLTELEKVGALDEVNKKLVEEYGINQSWVQDYVYQERLTVWGVNPYSSLMKDKNTAYLYQIFDGTKLGKNTTSITPYKLITEFDSFIFVDTPTFMPRLKEYGQKAYILREAPDLGLSYKLTSELVQPVRVKTTRVQVAWSSDVLMYNAHNKKFEALDLEELDDMVADGTKIVYYNENRQNDTALIRGAYENVGITLYEEGFVLLKLNSKNAVNGILKRYAESEPLNDDKLVEFIHKDMLISWDKKYIFATLIDQKMRWLANSIGDLEKVGVEKELTDAIRISAKASHNLVKETYALKWAKLIGDWRTNIIVKNFVEKFKASNLTESIEEIHNLKLQYPSVWEYYFMEKNNFADTIRLLAKC